MSNLKNNLRLILELQNIKQKDLAEKVYVKSQTINHYIFDQRTPDVYMALQIAHALGVKVEDIWEV